MRMLGKVKAIHTDSGVVRLDVEVDGELQTDVLAFSPLRVQPDLVEGDRVLVERLDGADAELIATPFHIMTGVTPYRIQVTSGGTVEIAAAGTAVELALKSDVRGILEAFGDPPGVLPVPTPGDGGATIVANILVAMKAAGLPVGTNVLKGE